MKNIKEIYETKINKEDIYNKVIDKIENRNKKYQISIVILVIIGIMIGIRVVYKNDYKITFKNPQYITDIDELANKVYFTNDTINDKNIKIKENILKILEIIMEGDIND